jgi:acyl carrier protein
LKEAVGVHAPVGIDPEELWALEAELPYEVEISWSVADAADCFDVILRRKLVDGAGEQVSVNMPRAAESVRPLAEYANVPLQEKLVRNLIANLRTSLAAQLPDYMLPSAFVPLRKFPLTHNGKVDTAALALFDQVRPEHEGPFVEPRTAVEVVVASVWAEVLRLEQVSVHNNFFELGGHSLLATQVVARLRNVFQMTIPLRSLFEAPTVAGLAAVITANQEKPGQVERIAELLQQMEDATT